MPGRNVVKQYVASSYYHLYNRGVEQRDIFRESGDYDTFLFFLKHYLSPTDNPFGLKQTDKNFCGQVELITYALMPNHYHLLVKQKDNRSIEGFMRCLATSYSIYFNKKYQRTGHLFEGTVKAVLIESEAQLLHLSRYIHLNPGYYDPILRRYSPKSLVDGYSSYKEYLGARQTAWLKPEVVLYYFKSNSRIGKRDYLSYQSFVEDYTADKEDPIIGLNLD